MQTIQRSHAKPDSYQHDNYQHLVTHYDHEYSVAWLCMKPVSRPCFTPDLLAEMSRFFYVTEQQVQNDQLSGKRGLQYQILASRIPGIFNLGGDLTLFQQLIRNRDRDGLLRYAESCIHLIHLNAVNYNLPVTTISLVQGDALGGGFEAALSSNVLIAERSAKMGLPEILFNLFPGMGAYNLLARRLDPARAQKLILSGKIYEAEELYEMGVVDVLANDGEGEQAVYAYIKKQNRSELSYQALRKIHQWHQPVLLDELMRIASLWVDTALQIKDKDLRTMERLARSQTRLTQQPRIDRRAANSPLRISQ